MSAEPREREQRMSERGPHFEMVTFSIDPNTLHELRALAREQGLPLARVLRRLVQIGFEGHKVGTAGAFEIKKEDDTDRGPLL